MTITPVRLAAGPVAPTGAGAALVSPVTFAAGTPQPTGVGYDVTQMTGGTPWAGVLAVEGIETGDQREFVDGALTWAELPLPLRRNIIDSHGGTPQTQTVLVGRIDQIYRDATRPNYIMGAGVFDDQGTYGAEAVRQVREGFLSGVSIDPDSITDADVELVWPEPTDSGGGPEDGGDLLDLFPMPELTRFHAGRIRAATLVDIPAFAEAKIYLTDGATSASAPAGVTAGAHFAEISRSRWNGPQAERQLSQGLTAVRARQAFAHVATGTAAGISARFLHHEILDAGQVGPANLTAVEAALRAIDSGRADAMSASDRRAAWEHLAAHLRAAGGAPTPLEDGEVLVAAGEFGHLLRPPAEWFANPQLRTLTPLTVTADGRVFGHGAAWGTCHVGYAGTCVSPPHEADHSYFRTGEVLCADGSRVAVGALTVGTGHAPVRGLNPMQAAEHYDHTGAVVALVASGEDAHGIWVAGAVRSDAAEERVATLRASALSGDWRRVGGKLRLVAFLGVNVPGFPVPRTAAYSRAGAQQTLVAAGVVSQDMRRVQLDSTVAHTLMAALGATIDRTPERRLAELRADLGR